MAMYSWFTHLKVVIFHSYISLPESIIQSWMTAAVKPVKPWFSHWWNPRNGKQHPNTTTTGGSENIFIHAFRLLLGRSSFWTGDQRVHYLGCPPCFRSTCQSYGTRRSCGRVGFLRRAGIIDSNGEEPTRIWRRGRRRLAKTLATIDFDECMIVHTCISSALRPLFFLDWWPKGALSRVPTMLSFDVSVLWDASVLWTCRFSSTRRYYW